MCIKCGSPAIYTHRLTLRAVTVDDELDRDTRTKISRFQGAIYKSRLVEQQEPSE